MYRIVALLWMVFPAIFSATSLAQDTPREISELVGQYVTVRLDAAEELAAMLLRLQGDGDYAGARRLIETLGVIEPQLQADLERLRVKGIPVDVVFEQGTDVLGL